jgi:hypothetical protein
MVRWSGSGAGARAAFNFYLNASARQPQSSVEQLRRRERFSYPEPDDGEDTHQPSAAFDNAFELVLALVDFANLPEFHRF